MANEMMLFNVDASEIIVKLHFGGLQAVKGDAKNNNGFIVNTGIIDDSPNGTPDKIGNTKFDLKNQSGMYCVGLVRDFTYMTLVDLDNAITDLFKMRSELAGDGKKLLDKDNVDDQKRLEEFESLKKGIKSAFEKAKSKYIPSDEDFNNADSINKVRAAAKKLQDEYVMPRYRKQLDDARKEAFVVLEKYMKVFAGEDNLKDMKVDNVMAVQVSNSFKKSDDKGLVKDFEIQAISKKERDTLNLKFKTEALSEWETGKDIDRYGEVKCDVRMCFYVKYMLKVEE